MTWPRYSLRTKLLVIAAALPVVWFVSLFFRVDKQYVDPMTGELKHTTSYWGVQMSEVIEPTALGTWLEARGQGQPPQWKFMSYQEGFGARGSGETAPMYYLRSSMPRMLELLSEAELLALIQVLRTGTQDEQMAAVEAIEKRL